MTDSLPPIVRFRTASGVVLVRLTAYKGDYPLRGSIGSKSVPVGAVSFDDGTGRWRPVKELPTAWGFSARHAASEGDEETE